MQIYTFLINANILMAFYSMTYGHPFINNLILYNNLTFYEGLANRFSFLLLVT